MPEAKSAAPFRRAAAVVIHDVTFKVVYNPFGATLGDYRTEERLSGRNPEEMTEAEFIELCAFRANLLARMIMEWDVTAFGLPVPLDPDAILDSLDAFFIAEMLSGIRADQDPKAVGEPTSSSEPPSPSEAKSPSASTRSTRPRKSSKTSPSPTE